MSNAKDVNVALKINYSFFLIQNYLELVVLLNNPYILNLQLATENLLKYALTQVQLIQRL